MNTRLARVAHPDVTSWHFSLCTLVHFEHHDIDTRRRARLVMHSLEIRAMHARCMKTFFTFTDL